LLEAWFLGVQIQLWLSSQYDKTNHFPFLVEHFRTVWGGNVRIQLNYPDRGFLRLEEKLLLCLQEKKTI